MAQRYSLEAVKRDKVGKGVARSLRRQGYVPGVYYDKSGVNIPLQIAYGTLASTYDKAQKSNVIDLEIKGGSDTFRKPVLIWDMQSHPIKDFIEHVDFIGVDLTEEMNVDVQVEVTGEAKGAEQGGIVSIFRDSISVTCLPTAIPDQISIDVSDLDINDNLYIEDIVLPEGVRLQDYDENFAVVGVAPPAPTEEELAEAEEGEAEGEEGASSEEGGSEEGSSGEEA